MTDISLKTNKQTIIFRFIVCSFIFIFFYLYTVMLGSKGILTPTNATDCFIAVQFSQSCKHLQYCTNHVLLTHEAFLQIQDCYGPQSRYVQGQVLQFLSCLHLKSQNPIHPYSVPYVLCELT